MVDFPLITDEVLGELRTCLGRAVAELPSRARRGPAGGLVG